jgi:hypothetical protein
MVSPNDAAKPLQRGGVTGSNEVKQRCQCRKRAKLHLSLSGEWGTTKHLSWSNNHDLRLSFDKVVRDRGSAPTFEVLLRDFQFLLFSSSSRT